MPDPRTAKVSDRQWFIVGRWQELIAEMRVNIVRLAALAALYAIQLWHYLSLSEPGASDQRFHQIATTVAVAWSLLGMGLIVCIRRHFFPPAMKYVSTGLDVILLSSLAAAGAGPNSPLVFAFFIVICLAGLRFSLRLVWAASIACMLGYLFTLGASDPTWFDADHVVPPVEQLVVLACLAFCGIAVGQIVRRVRALADDYAARISAHANAYGPAEVDSAGSASETEGEE